MGWGRKQKKKKKKKEKAPIYSFLYPCSRPCELVVPSCPVSGLSHVTCFHQWNVTEYVIACAFPLAVAMRKACPDPPNGPRRWWETWSRATHTHDRVSQTTDARAIPAGTSLDQLNLADRSGKKNAYCWMPWVLGWFVTQHCCGNG